MSDIIKLEIHIPSLNTWYSEFGIALIQLQQHIFSHGINGKPVSLVIRNKKGSVLSSNRHEMMEMAINADADLVFMVDCDMYFPRNIIDMLAEHDKDIVAANCCAKVYPSHAVARGIDGNRVKTLPDSSGLEEVDFVGFAVALVKPKAFKQVPMPWFDVVYLPELGRYQGEDAHFCRKAREYGIKTYIDHEASKRILHIGDFYYGHMHTPEWMDLEKESTDGAEKSE